MNQDRNRTDDLWDDDDQRRRDEAAERRFRGAVADLIRKALDNTVESVQTTQSASRDALQYLLQQGDRGKKEVVRLVSKEVGDFLRGINLSSELIKVLTGVELEVRASVRFRPTAGGGVRPDIRADVDASSGAPSDPEADDIA